MSLNNSWASDSWAWSYSRSKLLRDCPRAFSYATRARKAQASLNVFSLGALIGICVHHAVDDFISRWQEGAPMTLAQLRATGERQFDERWGQRNQVILEIANGVADNSVEPNRFRRAIRERLDRFYQFIWPAFRGSRHECHEEPAEFDILGHKIRFQIDFACWNVTDDLQIVDWKTGGAENQRGGEVQLAVYSLWAHEKFKLEPHRIKPIVASLLNGRLFEYEVTPYDLAYVEELVRDDYAATRVYSTAGAFPAYPAPEKCGSCRYLKTCPEGRELLSPTDEPT
ncbi:MAG: PD-(D/E)XK nuclease family protein [Candidatus Thermoplasmatota archaeon]